MDVTRTGWMLTAALCATACVTLGACKSIDTDRVKAELNEPLDTPRLTQQERLNQANAAYRAGDYGYAYRRAVSVASVTEPPLQESAWYLAGLAAYRMGEVDNATHYLGRAADSRNYKLATDAGITLGAAYAESGQFDKSAKAYLEAADMLADQPRADAYYHAAVSQQKAGHWPAARTNLLLARGYSDDPTFRTKINSQLNVTGYTLQTASPTGADSAQSAVAQLGVKQDPRLKHQRLVPVERDGQEYTVLQLGEFSNFESAREARDAIGADKAVIVPILGTPAP